MFNQRIDRSWACVTRLALVVFAGLAADATARVGREATYDYESRAVPRSVCYDF